MYIAGGGGWEEMAPGERPYLPISPPEIVLAYLFENRERSAHP